MKIAIVGTGYVGLVAGVCLADAGHRVTCVDMLQEKIDMLNEGKIPIYEPGLEDILKTSRSRLTFTTDIASAVKENTVIFIAVGTPEKDDGSADLGPTLAVVQSICKNANTEKVIVLKSTVPIGTGRQVSNYCKENCEFPIEVVNNPEFLKEGTAIDDFLRPDRVVLGCSSPQAATLMEEIYAPFVKNGHPIVFMDNTSAEMTKYAANSFLSVKISFINELARLADKVGADINHVRKGFTSDNRINPAFFYPGVGYGGSCFPKDVMALIKSGEENDLRLEVVSAADRVNDRQKLVHVEKAKEVFGDLRGKKFGFWGLSFKPRTDDVREAPALYMIEAFHREGAHVQAFDPVAGKNAKNFFPTDFQLCDSAIEAASGTDALFLVTEWNEFKNPNFEELKKVMNRPVLFDGRNIYNPQQLKQLGFDYYGIGRQKD